jgi:hypothetical protein
VFRILKQDRYLRGFEQAGAMDPSSARTLGELGLRESSVFRGLVRGGIISPSVPDRYFLVPENARRFASRRRQLALIGWGLAAVFFIVVSVASR